MHARDSTAIRGALLLLALAAGVRGQEAKMVEKEGRVVITKTGMRPAPAVVGVALAARDKLGTGESSRAVLQMSERWFARVDEETDIEITPGAIGTKDKDAIRVALGGAFVYSREEEGELKIVTPSATGGLRGTQLVVRVWPDGRTLMQVLEGEVTLVNDQGSVLLQAGEAGEAEKNQAPRKTAVIEIRNLLQWALYYPAVLHPGEFGLMAAEQGDLAASLAAYQQGDLLAALVLWPAGYAPASDGARLYRSAILLATGRVEAARVQLRSIPADNPGRQAIERMVAAVLGGEQPALGEPRLAGEALAESYYQQSRRNLEAARAAARRATELAPQSGFAWTRLAELEFSFGRTRAARQAIEKGTALTPRNAQARALLGYVLSAENRVAEARKSFEEAVGLDGGLGNAWLGLGLTKIKQGHLQEGRADLQTAATVEPTRAFFYSYHGKALSQEGRKLLARKDLTLAKQLDPEDPTPWLYSAIQTQQEYRYNDAIADLQESLRLNDNRRVYRSRFLLDQDSAVRSANLAKLYENNAMADLSVREATRAVESDYTNASAHLFLANSYDAKRDPANLLLRYDSAWFNELLMANLLAPVGGGPLSQFVSQQEYSKLFSADGFGGSSLTEWREGYLDQKLSLFASHGRLGGGLDFKYKSDDGLKANSDRISRELFAQMKYQAGPDDLLYSLVHWKTRTNGDTLQTYSNLPGNPGQRLTENEKPGLLLLGWNHRWAPGVHTLFLGGRLAADQTLVAPGVQMLLLLRDPAVLQPGFLRPKAGGGLEYASTELRTASVPPVFQNPNGSLTISPTFLDAVAPYVGVGSVTDAFANPFDYSTTKKFTTWSGEIQHVWQTSRNTLLVGGRAQTGKYDITTLFATADVNLTPFLPVPSAAQKIRTDFSRQSAYVYDYLTLAHGLTLLGGLSWDRIERPDNWRNPPVNARQVIREKTNPKAGFTFAPTRWVTLRGAYAEALGGVSFDEEVRLEPVAFAGINQAFRTVISESLVGSVETPVYRNRGGSAEGMLPTRTWWQATYNDLTENVDRTRGAFDILTASVFPAGYVILPSGRAQTLGYREEVFAAGLNQLLGREFALAAGYRRTRATLHTRELEITTAITPLADTLERATLQELTLNLNWNSPAGWFARAEANWFDQTHEKREGTQPSAALPGDRFWQYNVQTGYRFHRNLREISVGWLNLSDQDFLLSPLTYTAVLPQQRTFFIRCRLSF
jgi:Flp pilus assembly protein TadD